MSFGLDIQSIAYGILGLAVLAASFRLIQGPTLPDRVLALDLLALLTVGATATYSIDSGESVFLDVAIVIALVSFLATIAFARYIERGS